MQLIPADLQSRLQIELAELFADTPPVHLTPPGPILRTLADVESRQAKWVVQNMLAEACVSVLAGQPKVGKGLVTMDIAARITTGTPMPDGSAVEKGSVILIPGEDDPHFTIRPRFDAHHGDPNRIKLFSMTQRFDSDGTPHTTMFSLKDLPELKTALQQTPDCKLVIIDPIGSFLGGDIDAYRDNEVRAVLAPLAKLAEEQGVAVLLVCHWGKGGEGRADDRILGSRAFSGLARSIWHVVKDPDNDARRLLLPGGSNMSASDAGYAFTLLPDPLRVVWEKERVTTNIDEVLARTNSRASRADKTEAIKESLLVALEDGLWHPKDEVMERVRMSCSGTVSERTIDRARVSLRVDHVSKGFPAKAMWRLPPKR